MSKFVGGIVLGVFLGALAIEVVNRTNPELLEKTEEKARNAARRLSDMLRGRSIRAWNDY